MIKFFRKIRQRFIAEGKTTQYLKYAAGEIVLVVIGILIALQLNIGRENQKKAALETGYLKGILNDLDQDINDLNGLMEKDTSQFTAFTQVLRAFTDTSIDVHSMGFLKHLGTAWGFHSFNGNSIVFQDMKSSGSVHLIKSDELRFSILEYYNDCEVVISNQNGLRKTTTHNFINEAFLKNLDMNSLAEPLLFKEEWCAEIDPLELSFFKSDPQSQEVKNFANYISMTKALLWASHGENWSVLDQATSLQKNINAYLDGTEMNVLPEMPNEILNAIETGNTEQLEKLVADETLNDCFRIPYPSYTYLVVAIRAGSFASAKYFIDRGVNLESYCKNKSPLMYSVQYGRMDVFEYLLEKGANPKTTIEGKTALDFAIKYERKEFETVLRAIK